MFEVRRTVLVSAAHSLTLPYESKCRRLHGHNWRVTVICRAESLDASGMVVDFSRIKSVVDALDHANLNEVLRLSGEPVNPTAENIARCVAHAIGETCAEVRVEEVDGSVAIWTK